jgi:hypothetical protein
VSVTPLSYAPVRPPLIRRIPARSAILWIVAFAVTAASARYGRSLLLAADRMYLQQVCASYSAPPSQVVYEEDPRRSGALRESDTGVHGLPLLHAEDGAAAVRSCSTWERYAKLRGLFVDERFRDGATLFLHRLRAPSGQQRIVYLGYHYDSLHAGRYAVIHPYGWDGEPPASRTQQTSAVSDRTIDLFERYFPTHTHARDFRFYAGQPDPKDRSHFTVEYEWAGRRGWIHGWLRDDATVTFKVTALRERS